MAAASLHLVAPAIACAPQRVTAGRSLGCEHRDDSGFVKFLANSFFFVVLHTTSSSPMRRLSKFTAATTSRNRVVLLVLLSMVIGPNLTTTLLRVSDLPPTRDCSFLLNLLLVLIAYLRYRSRAARVGLRHWLVRGSDLPRRVPCVHEGSPWRPPSRIHARRDQARTRLV